MLVANRTEVMVNERRAMLGHNAWGSRVLIGNEIERVNRPVSWSEVFSVWKSEGTL